MNKLYIDTRDNSRIIVRLNTDHGEFIKESKANIQKAQAALPLIEKVLSKSGVKKNEIKEIEIEKGPGSFTGLRVGIAIANALSLALGVKINEKPLGEMEIPQY